jgi:hypothetical protein
MSAQDQPPSLYEQSFRTFQSTLKSPEAQFLAKEFSSPNDGVDPEVVNLIKAAELAHIPVKGRITGTSLKVDQYGVARGCTVVNAHGKIDSARLCAYDPVEKAIKIRMDHTTIPDFYIEFWLSMAQIMRFVASVTSDEEGEESEDESMELEQ